MELQMLYLDRAHNKALENGVNYKKLRLSARRYTIRVKREETKCGS
jgi:hypothetical protein